jgi:hypothetical protein
LRLSLSGQQDDGFDSNRSAPTTATAAASTASAWQ